MIYLRASVSTLLHRIDQRSRDYEKSISPEYLQRLNDLYRQWIDHFTLCPVLTVPSDDLDYVAHPATSTSSFKRSRKAYRQRSGDL